MGTTNRSRSTPGGMTVAEGLDRPRLPTSKIERARRTRRHPRITQFDYLHLQRLADDLTQALARVPEPVDDVLDVFCGTRPYDDLLPSGARCIGLDIDDHFGSADVISHDFLPFEDDSFDLVLCISGFHYLPDPRRGVEEIRRVLRPGGTALITVPLLWEYSREVLEHRYTGPALAELFSGWEDVETVENGGRGVAWGLLTGHLIYIHERRLPPALRTVLRPLFALTYVGVNLAGMAFERSAEREVGEFALPPNLLLRARSPGR